MWNSSQKGKIIQESTEVYGEQMWRRPAASLKLAAHQVHVWRADLDLHRVRLGDYQKLLSVDEQQRASRYRFERDRNWYVVRRGLLRILISKYLEISPDSIKFVYNRYGKPYLDQEFSSYPICFNLSHSAALALFGFCLNISIGIDIERQRNDFNHLELAERFFSPYEIETLSSLPSELRPIGFFSCWTRKEAFIKAHGKGLSLALDAFDVSLLPDQPARLLATRGDLPPADEWTMINLDPAPGYLAALAVNGQIHKLCLWDLDLSMQGKIYLG